METNMSATSVRLRRKLFILYGLTFALPMLFMLGTILNLLRGIEAGETDLSAAKWSVGVGVAASLVVSAGSFCFMYPSIRAMERVARDAESFVRESGGENLHLVKTGDEAEKIASYTDQMIRELREKLSDINKCADQLDVANHNLMQCAVRDGLTGLYNQSYAKDRVGAELAHADRTGGSVSVIMLDVNDFKGYNDRYGHLAGDKALKEISSVVGGAVRDTDIACRYGGDEFLVLLPGTPRREAEKVASRIRKEIASRRIGAASPSDTTALKTGVGVATYPDEATSAEELIHRADGRLYNAKGTQLVSVSEVQEQLRLRRGTALAVAS